jgi:hypothetical protein
MEIQPTCDITSYWIPLLSLVIAGLAVFVGPIISARIAKRQIVAPLRQEWTNSLRKLIAEICSRGADYRHIGAESPLDNELRTIFALSIEIELFLDPADKSHKKLLGEIQNMVMLLKGTLPDDDSKFWKARNNVMVLTRSIFVSEWESQQK